MIFFLHHLEYKMFTSPFFFIYILEKWKHLCHLKLVVLLTHHLKTCPDIFWCPQCEFMRLHWSPIQESTVHWIFYASAWIRCIYSWTFSLGFTWHHLLFSHMNTHTHTQSLCICTDSGGVSLVSHLSHRDKSICACTHTAVHVHIYTPICVCFQSVYVHISCLPLV